MSRKSEKSRCAWESTSRSSSSSCGPEFETMTLLRKDQSETSSAAPLFGNSGAGFVLSAATEKTDASAASISQNEEMLRGRLIGRGFLFRRGGKKTLIDQR